MRDEVNSVGIVATILDQVRSDPHLASDPVMMHIVNCLRGHEAHNPEQIAAFLWEGVKSLAASRRELVSRLTTLLQRRPSTFVTRQLDPDAPDAVPVRTAPGRGLIRGA